MFVTADLCIDNVFVPPDGERHHGVAVGHDDDGEDVLGDEDEGVVETAPPLLHSCHCIGFILIELICYDTFIHKS